MRGVDLLGVSLEEVVGLSECLMGIDWAWKVEWYFWNWGMRGLCSEEEIA